MNNYELTKTAKKNLHKIVAELHGLWFDTLSETTTDKARNNWTVISSHPNHGNASARTLGRNLMIEYRGIQIIIDTSGGWSFNEISFNENCNMSEFFYVSENMVDTLMKWVQEIKDNYDWTQLNKLRS